MGTGLTVECDVNLTGGRRGRKKLREGKAPEQPDVPVGRVPRVSRLMALAIRFERLVEEGHVRDYAEIARLGHVSRARLTQVMNLRQLAPDIQEEILFLPRVISGKDPITERDLRPIAAEPDWEAQRGMWGRIWEAGRA
ncbi:MAG: hypothetical protein QGH74_10350 [Candidatus Brocadiia bacterium]|jgi:hypothetical protein|nr:hypothetical protein [Candidatus Brocadiia bacterium]